MQRFGLETASKTNYYMYADTLTQCSSSSPHPFTLHYVFTNEYLFFMLAEYMDVEVGEGV